MSSFPVIVDSAARKDRDSTFANSFSVSLSTPIYGVSSILFTSASIPFIRNYAQVNTNVNAYYITLEVPDYGVLNTGVRTVDNPFTYRYDEATTTATGILGASTVTVASSTGITAGMQIYGLGEVNTITSVSGSTLTLENALAANYTSQTVNVVREVKNRYDVGFTGSLIVPADVNATMNYTMSTLNDGFSFEKVIPSIDRIKISIYYFNTTTESYELYPFQEGNTPEEFVIKFELKGFKDKRMAIKKQDEDDERIEVDIQDPVEKGERQGIIGQILSIYKGEEDMDKKELAEPRGAMLPRKEFMGIPGSRFHLIIPIAIIVMVIAILLAKK